MNVFDARYRFRLASCADLNEIMDFMKVNWAKDHIFATNKSFLKYEHQNGSQINFVLAINKVSGKIEALQGFIPYSRIDRGGHICGVIACVAKSTKTPFLGIETLRRMKDLTRPNTYCGIGTNPKTMIPLVKNFLGHATGKMQHFYRLNNNVQNFVIPIINKRPTLKFKYRDSKQLFFEEIISYEELIKKFDLTKSFDRLPRKEPWYIEKRYFRHPIYNYSFFLLRNNIRYVGLLVGREVSLNNVKIFRFVDFIGEINHLACIGKEIENLIITRNYEYVDFLCSGIDPDIFSKSGFRLKESSSKNVIPTFFEPFLQENNDIFFEKLPSNLVLFKADADQDRPRYS